MQYLIDQVRVFRARAALHTLHLVALTQHHRPRAMLISCSDARIVPALLTAARPGNLFELRTYGGVIPPYDTKTPDRQSRTIEYAVDELGVSDIIVCGHSHCDVVTEVMHDSLRHRGVRRRSGPADRRRHRRRALTCSSTSTRPLSGFRCLDFAISVSSDARRTPHAARRDGSGRMAASFSRGIQFDHVMPKGVRGGWCRMHGGGGRRRCCSGR
ncbi:carbonic anhydrase [Streptomyces canus]|uniref:carbonic anhydrase n=1 Tax=Streptomyces canus TaxID=58343 RepID=UPI0036A6DA63